MENVAEEEKLGAALEHFANGRLRDTEILCRQILAAQPQHDQALHLMGVLANRAGRHDVAVELMQRAIAISPQTAVYHSNLGVVLTASGQFADAERACRQAVALNPTLAEAHYNLGNALAGGRRSRRRRRPAIARRSRSTSTIRRRTTISATRWPRWANSMPRPRPIATR